MIHQLMYFIEDANASDDDESFGGSYSIYLPNVGEKIFIDNDSLDDLRAPQKRGLYRVIDRHYIVSNRQDQIIPLFYLIVEPA